MAKTKRKERDSEMMEKVDFSKPLLDIYKLGGDEDPCFGKHHDLTAPECARCGDSELCQIATMQRQTLERDNDETKYMDQAHDNQTRVQKTAKRLVKLGKKDSIIIDKLIAKYGITKTEAKAIIKKLR